jgi:uncharacterized protein YjbJ (UPF0337 family)
VKGQVKEATGALTDNKDLESEGKVEAVVDKAKDTLHRK